MKRLLKKLIPRRIRLWRYAFYDVVRNYLELIFSLGSGLECPYCGWHFRRLRPGGLAYPVLIRNRVVGAGPRPNVHCPRCKSHDRERLMYLFLRNETKLLQQGGRLLHVAPERRLRKILSGSGLIEYFSTDRFDPDVMLTADLLSPPFQDGWFEAVLCNHVLEHVDDDRRGMREICRVLKPGGWAILQVPIALVLNQTIEDPGIKDENERIRRFGQRDHVRMYAPHDYPERLREAGFDVFVIPYAKQLGPARVARYALVAEENIYLCRKPGASALNVSSLRPCDLDLS